MTKKQPSSLALAQAVFSKAAEGKKLAEKRKRELRREQAIKNAFPYLKLPFDIQEMILQYLPSGEIGMCCAVSKRFGHIYQGAVASIFAEYVGVARGRSKLVRTAELQLIHRLRNTHDKETAIETSLWAAFNGYNDYVMRLIRTKAVDVNDRGSADWDNATILHVACRQGNCKLVQSLLKCGADPACATKSKQTPLILACDYGWTEVVEYLLEHCGRTLKVNEQDASGRTALFAACEKGHLEIVEKLVDWGELMQQTTGESEDILDMNLGTIEWGSPLNVAARHGQSKIVQKLLSSQVNVNKTTEDGRTALFCAVERGAIQTTKMILQTRPPVTEEEMTQLLYQARPNDGLDAARQRAETETEIPNVHHTRCGCLIDLASNTGKTAVFVAAERGNVALLQVLIDARADTNKPTFLNKTPLYAATEQGHTEVVKQLLDFATREHVLHQTNFGTTAVFMAQRNGHMTIKTLLSEFCMEKLHVEKKKKRKSKKSQNQAMNRLFTLKKDGSQKKKPATAPCATRENMDSEQKKRERLDADISKSMESVENISLQVNQLSLAVDAIYSQQRQGKGTTAKARLRSVRDVVSEIIQDKLEDDDNDYGNGNEEEEEDAYEEVEEQKTGTNFVKKHEERIIGKPVLFNPDFPTSDKVEYSKSKENSSFPEPVLVTNTQQDQHVTEKESIGEETKQNEEPESVTPKPTVADVRRSRAAFFENKFKKENDTNTSATDIPAETRNEEDSSKKTRLIPKKEKEVMAARKFSETFNLSNNSTNKNKNNNEEEEAGKGKISLPGIRTCLLNFSKLTSSYKMSSDIFEKTFDTYSDKVKPLYDMMKGSKQSANAWDVFVASTLASESTPAEKLSFCFGLFDAKSQGSIDPSVARAMLKCCSKAVSKMNDNANPLEKKEELDQTVTNLFGEKEVVSQENFVEWAQSSSVGEKLFASVLQQQVRTKVTNE